MPFHQNLNLLQRWVGFEEASIRCRQSAHALAHLPSPPAGSPAPPAAPSLLWWGLPQTYKFPVSLQLLRTSDVEARMRRGSSTAPQLPPWEPVSALGTRTPALRCQNSDPTREEFKIIPKPNRSQVHSNFSFSCNLMSAAAQLGNMSHPLSWKSNFEQKARNHGLSNASGQTC